MRYHIVEGYYPRGALTGEGGRPKVLTNLLGMELELTPGREIGGTAPSTTINGIVVNDLQSYMVANGTRVGPITAVLLPADSAEVQAFITPPGSTDSEAAESPVGIIAIGHSGLTGEWSDPNRPGFEARENSWATGTASEVNSIYQRLVATRPETAGHVANLAQAGGPAAALANQARAALRIVPTPELVIIQTIDGDIRCDGTDAARLVGFGAAVAAALDVITEASPESRILMVSQMGRPVSYAAAIADIPEAVARFSGSGMCDLFNVDGTMAEDRLATLTAIIESYEAEQARVCAAVPQCATDAGVLTAYVDDIQDWAAGDWNHRNVQGLARQAALIWPAVETLLGK